MLYGTTPEELSAVLDQVVREVLDQAGVAEPPVDAVAVARALGMIVATDNRQQGRARCVRLQGPRGRQPRPTILVRPDERSERTQWAVAHEIGEHLAIDVFDALAINPRETSPDTREMVSNRLAGRILLPGDWYARDAAVCGWDLPALKRRYNTASHEMLARRMLELPVPVIISIFDQGRRTWRRANIVGRVPPPSEAELRCWQVAHHESRPEQASDGPQFIQAWPVHEPQWKREILRTEVQLEPVS